MQSVPEEATSPTPVFVVPCPVCGHVGVHQHGARFFNGYNLVNLPEHVVGNNNSTSRGGRMATPQKNSGKDDVFYLQRYSECYRFSDIKFLYFCITVNRGNFDRRGNFDNILQ